MSRNTLGIESKPPRWYREVGRQGWKGFWAAWIGYLLDGFDFVLITLVLTEVMGDFHLNLMEGASLVSAAFVSRWFGGLVIGGLSDAYGRKPGMILSILLYSAGSLGCALAPGYWWLFIARLVVGFGMAGEYSASSLYVIESWPQRLRNKASGFLISGFSIGAVVAGQIYHLVVPGFGWRALFFIGLIPVVIALWLRRSLREASDWETSAKARPVGEKNDMLRFLFAGRYRVVNVATAVVAAALLFLMFTGVIRGLDAIMPLGVVVAAIFVSYIAQFSKRRWPCSVVILVTVFAAFLYGWPIQALLPTYLKAQLGYSSAQVADVIFFSGFGAAVGCILAGFMGDRFGTRRTYWGSLLISQVLIFPVFLVGGSNLLLLGGLLFVQQMLGQGIAGLLPKWIGGYFGVRERASNLGFIYNVGALGGAVAPTLGAAISEHMPLGMSLASISFVLTFVVIVLVGFNVPALAQRWLHPEAARAADINEGFSMHSAEVTP